MKKVIILGAGLVGKVMAADLSKDYEVTVADFSEAALKEVAAGSSSGSKQPAATATVLCDFSDKNKLKDIVKPFDLVIGAVPGFMGFEVLKTIIEAGKNVIDISFFPENALELDELAKKQNITAIVDFGVAPGMCNIIAGYHNARMKMTMYECLVGGLPQVREWPFEYKAVFSPIDVIEEYTRPARYVENGKVATREALSDIEKVAFFLEDGSFPSATATATATATILESFNSDGLRSLAITMPNVPNMKEKTLRYPGHAELMRIFRETGFFSKEKININGKEISPLEVTTKLLFPKWKMKEGDEDFTVMRVTIEGDEKGKPVKYVYHLHDTFDRKTKTTSMARTTGYTCTAAAHLVLENKYNRKGIIPPEYIGEDESCFHFVLDYLKERNVIYKKEML